MTLRLFEDHAHDNCNWFEKYTLDNLTRFEKYPFSKYCNNYSALLEKWMIYAGFRKDLEIIIYLVEEKGCNIKADNNMMPQELIYNGGLFCMRYLVENNLFDPITWNGWMIAEAAQNGHLELVKYLYTLGGRLDYEDIQESLQVTSARGHVMMFKYLWFLRRHNNPDKKPVNPKIMATITDKFDIYKGALCDLIEMI
jgi:hypothetical protein